VRDHDGTDVDGAHLNLVIGRGTDWERVKPGPRFDLLGAPRRQQAKKHSGDTEEAVHGSGYEARAIAGRKATGQKNAAREGAAWKAE